MSLGAWLYAAIILCLSAVSGASALEIRGGSGVLAGSDSSVQGSFVADRAGASAVAGGTALGYVQDHFVQDTTGKRAQIYLNVTGAVGSVGYKATFAPRRVAFQRFLPYRQPRL